MTRLPKTPPFEGRWEVALSALVISILVVAMTLVILRGAQSNREVIALKHAEQIRFLATDFLLTLRRAESSQRGYILTGNSLYLQGYRAGQTNLPIALSRLEEATSSQPIQRLQVARIAANYEIKRREMAETLNEMDAGRRSEALRILNSNLGFNQMDIITNDVNAVIRFENAKASDIDSRYSLIFAGSLIILIMIVVSGVVTFYRIVRFSRASTAHGKALARSNAELAALLASRTAEIARVNEEIQRYAYIVGHDLRGPLINITGFTAEIQNAQITLDRQFQSLKITHPESLAQDALAAVEQDIPEAIRFISASAEKMDRLIVAVLKLSREGQRAIVAEPVAMRALIGELVDCQAQQIEAGRCRVVIGGLPDLVSDRLAVELIFGNLIENAVKYLDPERPGQIDIRGKRQGERNVYEIADNGRGIAAADRERVFELFRRAGQQTVAGEGLGLAFVRNAIYRLDGTVSLESVPGVGTQFTVTLPAAMAAPAAPVTVAA